MGEGASTESPNPNEPASVTDLNTTKIEHNQEKSQSSRGDSSEFDDVGLNGKSTNTDPQALHNGLIEISLVRRKSSASTIPLSYSDQEAVEELLECSKDGDLTQYQRICSSLRRRHIPLDSGGFMGWTSAHWAAREGHLHILKYLCVYAPDYNLDLLDKKGDTLLHKAAANGQYRVCEWLLEQGFNVQAVNNNGHTPLDLAQQYLAISKSKEATMCEAILAQENANTF